MGVTDLMTLLKITVSDSESSAALDEPNLKSILLGTYSVILSFVINDQPIRKLKFIKTEISLFQSCISSSFHNQLVLILTN